MKTAIIFLIFSNILMICFFLFMAAPSFFTWLGRIHMGRINNYGAWQKKLEKSVSKQVEKNSRVPHGENDIVFLPYGSSKGRYAKNLQLWQTASLLVAAREGGLLNKLRYEKTIKKMTDSDGEIKNDYRDPALGILAFSLWPASINKSDEKSLKDFYLLVYKALEGFIGEDDTLCYNKNKKSLRFVDSVGMVCPFLTDYAIKFECSKALELARRQIEDFYSYGMDKDSGLPFHCYDIKNHKKGGIIGWGRGCAWWAIGLIDTYLTIKRTDSVEQKTEFKAFLNDFEEFLRRLIIDFTDKILQAQSENGAWSRHLFFDSVPDSSATAVLAWFLIQSNKIKNRPACKEAAIAALGYLKSVTRRDGRLDFSQGDTMGVGFYSSRLMPMPFSQGFCLRALYALNDQERALLPAFFDE